MIPQIVQGSGYLYLLFIMPGAPLLQVICKGIFLPLAFIDLFKYYFLFKVYSGYQF